MALPLTASQTLEAVYNSLAPLWVELSFLFFFSMGFFYLRAENFRKGKKFQKDGTSRVKGLEPQFRVPVPLLKLAFIRARIDIPQTDVVS